MGKDWLNTPRHAASVSVAYPQGRTWSARVQSMAVQLLLTVLVVWFAVTGLTAVGLHFRPYEPSTKYVLVIDGGSSGTRIFAYSWVLPTKQSAPANLPVVQAIPPEAAVQLIPKKEKKGLYNRVETQPGLHAFVGDPAGLEAAALQPLLAWAHAVVPAHQHAATPLFMLGTGGLRGLELQARKALMGDIRSILAASGFRFHATWAKVISGTDEGVYGWLALNYGSGLLAQQQAASPAVALGRRSGSTATTATPIALSLPSSLGSLDMGGSSLELTFEVLQGTSNDPAAAVTHTGLQNITIGDRTFYLHTHTFHRYGLNEAYDRSVTLLLEQQRKAEEQAAALHDNAKQQEQPEKLLQPGVLQVEQQQRQQHAGLADLPHSNQPGAGIAAALPGDAAFVSGAGDTAAAAAVSLPGPSASAALAQQHAQVDLAVAAAAGRQPDVGPPPQAGNISSGNNGGGISDAEEHAQHQRQADLAVAAAAGLQAELPTAATVANGAAAALADMPQPSAPEVHSADIMRQHIQADLAMAAAAGLLPTHKPQPDSDVTATSSSVVGSGDSSSSSMAVSSGSEHLDTATSSVAALAASRVDAAAAAAPQPGSSSKSHSNESHGSELSQHIASKHYDGGALQQRALHFLHRRQQQRQQRQLLLQQHRYLESMEVMALDTFSSSIKEHTSAASTSTRAVPVAATQQPCIQQTSLHLLHRLRRLLSDHIAPALPPSLMHISHQGSTHDRVDSSTDTTTPPGTAASEPVTALRSSDDHISSDHGGAVSALPQHSGSQAPVLPVAHGSPQHVAGGGGSNATAGLPEVWHPCLHDGYTAEYDRLAYGGIVSHPAKVLLRGRPDWSACLSLVDKIVNASAPCQVSTHRPHCRLGTAQPELQGSFMALTGFYVVWKFLQVLPDAPVGALLDASRDLCSQPWKWVNVHLGHNINVERYCTWGPYTVKLLRQGLHLQDKDIRIGSGDVGWPLGAALAEASKIPEMMGRPSTRNARHAWDTAAHAPSTTAAGTSSGHGNLKHGISGITQHGGTSTAHMNSLAQHDPNLEGGEVQKLGGQQALTSTATAGGASIHSDIAKQQQQQQQQQQVSGTMGETYIDGPQPGFGGSDSDTESHLGVWQFSQRRSWAQAIFGSRRHTHIIHILLLFLFVAVWLSLVVYCLPSRGLIRGHMSGPGLFFLPVAFRGLHGPGKAQHILPLAAFSAQGGQSGRRNIPSPARGMKYMGA